MGPMAPMLLQAMAGNALVYLGIAVTNARLASPVLDGFYGATTPAARAAVMLVVLGYPANLLIAACYRTGSVADASMAVLVTAVVSMVASVLLLDGPMSSRAWVAAAAVVAAAAWFAYESAPG